MAQNLETFYGLKVTVARDFERHRFEKMRNAAKAFFESLADDEKDAYKVYVTRVELIVCKERVFKVGPISERIDHLNIKLTVNQKERQTRRIFFLNNRVDKASWLLSSNAAAEATDYQIKVRVDGPYCNDEEAVELLVLTYVRETLPDRSRKIKLTATAYPTPLFAARIRNAAVMTTGLDYWLNSEVQLLLEFDPNESRGRSAQ